LTSHVRSLILAKSNLQYTSNSDSLSVVSLLGLSSVLKGTNVIVRSLWLLNQQPSDYKPQAETVTPPSELTHYYHPPIQKVLSSRTHLSDPWQKS